MEDKRMRRIHGWLCVGMLTVLTLAGCSSTASAITTTGSNTETPGLPTTTAAATTSTDATATPSSNAVATHTPSHSPTKTPTPDPYDCGVVTATTMGTNTTTKPSNPQSREDCFTDAFLSCQTAHIILTFIDSTGKTTDSIQTPPSGGNCEVAYVQESKFPTGGSVTSAGFNCVALVGTGGGKYSLRECDNNEWINFP
jgi:hypothetical protein